MDTEEADRGWENAKHKYIKKESEELKMKKKIDQIRYGEREGAKGTIREKRKNRERWEEREREKWQKKKKVIKAVVAQSIWSDNLPCKVRVRVLILTVYFPLFHK